MTDYETILKMLGKAQERYTPRVIKSGNEIETDNEITINFHPDGSLWYISNDRYCDRAD